jgi:ferrochelatase
MKLGIVLMNLGGPDSLEAVEPFLYNLFRDPEIINFPGSFLFRDRLARLIAKKRHPRIQEQYRSIGGRSLVNEYSKLQAELLEKKMKELGFDCKVYTAMRYWHPLTEEVMDEIEKDGIDRIVMLPLYPQFSKSTTGSSVLEWDKLAINRPVKNIETSIVQFYYDHPLYLNAVTERIEEGIKRFPEEKRNDVCLLFSAHGTPMKLVKEGDSYSQQIAETVKAVMAHCGLENNQALSFQSKVGPQKWLKPSTPETIERLALEGVKNILIVPIAFVSDHLETLFEIGVEFRELAHTLGYEQFEVTEGLNGSSKFIDALADLTFLNLNPDPENPVKEYLTDVNTAAIK